VFGGVRLAGFLGVLHGVQVVAMRRMGVLGGLGVVVVAGVLGSLAVVRGSVLVMLGRLLVVVGDVRSVRHGVAPGRGR
jgi:hypothetical protein